MPRTKGAKDLKPRKRRVKKEPTVRMRVPESLFDKVTALIRKKVGLGNAQQNN
jgi:hypothetical protein